MYGIHVLLATNVDNCCYSDISKSRNTNVYRLLLPYMLVQLSGYCYPRYIEIPCQMILIDLSSDRSMLLIGYWQSPQALREKMTVSIISRWDFVFSITKETRCYNVFYIRHYQT